MSSWSNNFHKPHKLRTRKQLRAEMRRIDMELVRTGERLMMDREMLSERLRLDYWLRYISEKTQYLAGTVEWALVGYNFVADLIKERRGEKTGTTPKAKVLPKGKTTTPKDKTTKAAPRKKSTPPKKKSI